MPYYVNLFPSNLNEWPVLLELEWEIINSVFVTLRDNLLAFIYLDKVLRSRFIRFTKVSSERYD